mgnify:CR=1 FL=1
MRNRWLLLVLLAAGALAMYQGRSYNHLFTPADGLGAADVRALAGDQISSRMWVGTWGGGVTTQFEGFMVCLPGSATTEPGRFIGHRGLAAGSGCANCRTGIADRFGTAVNGPGRPTPAGGGR